MTPRAGAAGDVVVRRIRGDEGARLRTIRLAALADAPSAFSSTHAEEAAREVRWWEDAAVRRSSGDREVNFVAERDGELVGLVGAFVDDHEPGVAHLVSMWVASAARGSGLGAALVGRAVGWAAEVTEATEVRLWVTTSNEAAIRMYRRMGFVETGETAVLPTAPCGCELQMRRTVDRPL